MRRTRCIFVRPEGRPASDKLPFNESTVRLSCLHASAPDSTVTDDTCANMGVVQSKQRFIRTIMFFFILISLRFTFLHKNVQWIIFKFQYMK